MKINREELIAICDKYLAGKIDKKSVERFAESLISTDNHFWEEDDIISETLFDWDNEALNFEINNINMLLWKNRLLTGIDDLPKYNIWNYHIDAQKDTCAKYGSQWSPFSMNLKIGISKDLDKYPLHGLRHLPEKGTSGWFIWSGEFKEDADFFSPIHAKHLLQLKPQLIKYLALEPGFRFLYDKDNSYEDVWPDESLKR